MEKIFLGIKGHIVCLDKNTGNTIWTTKLKSTSGITNVFLDGDKLIAYSSGHIFCLQSSDGELLWTNTLKGFGYGPCIIATENQNSSAVANQFNAQQAPVAATVAATGASSANSNN